MKCGWRSITRSLCSGGGHPGAIGFRIPAKEIDSLDKFLAGLAEDLAALSRAAEDEQQETHGK
jgi:nanoRNase/pAp phosphatase (c-di-AMP/oligoRNAs hydrolase)